MSDRPKKLPHHSGVCIVTTETSVIYYQTSTNEEVDPEEKKSVDDNPLELKTYNSLTVDTLETLNGIRIHDPSKYLTTVMEQHYRTKKKQEQEEETDWRDKINVGKTFDKYKPQLLKRLEKFSYMWDGHVGKSNGPDRICTEKCGSLRFCVYYRRLNAATVRDLYPTLRMDEFTHSLATVNVFSTLDRN